MDRKPPVKVGQRLELKCISTGKQGDGICKYEGMIIVVPEAEVDKKYTVEVYRILPKVAFGKIVE